MKTFVSYWFAELEMLKKVKDFFGENSRKHKTQICNFNSTSDMIIFKSHYKCYQF